jgi:4-nitrophenol 2-monooxygenase / 4-nitrocatechol 4-monooxygenase, reductase component
VAVTPAVFRHVLGHLAGGVTVVTTRDDDGRHHGLTATAVCSVSLEPPLVLASLERDANTHAIIERSGVFALNFLADSEREVAIRFATTPDDKFQELAVTTAHTGSPLLVGAVAWCDCVVVRSVEAGDHTVFIGRVEAAEVRRPEEPHPLVHYAGRWATLCD